MKEEISKTELEKFHHYGTIFTVLFLMSVLGVIPLIIWHNLYVIIAYVLLYAVTMYFAVKVEKIKKQNNIHTYREIVAFTEGKAAEQIETNAVRRMIRQGCLPEYQHVSTPPSAACIMVLSAALCSFGMDIMIALWQVIGDFEFFRP